MKKMTMKGLSKSSTRNIGEKNFENSINSIPQSKIQSWILKSKNHVINLTIQEKESLNNYDDKRYISTDGIHTLPYGYYKI